MGTLYVVATPIGNLEDITLRALRVLGEVDLLLAEDTRRSRILLDRHGLAQRPLSLHAHNEASRRVRVLEILEAGGSVALVSDAGTPLVSDPGEHLVEAAAAAGHRVEALPGPSALLAALTVSGLPAVPFVFLGFLPRRPGARRRLLERQRHRAETVVLFESPQRLGATLAELRERLGERRACVARELTKLHEEVARGSLGELAERFTAGARGEVTLVVEGAAGAVSGLAGEADPRSLLDAAILALLARGCSPKDVSGALAPALGRPRREVYARAVELRRSV